jgi:hypothetical protein
MDTVDLQTDNDAKRLGHLLCLGLDWGSHFAPLLA